MIPFKQLWHATLVASMGALVVLLSPGGARELSVNQRYDAIGRRLLGSL
jgi:hypothetical protein